MCLLYLHVGTLRWRRCVLTVPACGDTKMEEVCAYCTCSCMYCLVLRICGSLPLIAGVCVKVRAS